MAASVVFKTEQIKTRLKRAQIALAPAVMAYAKGKANEYEKYMKANAPWTDRTGNARRGLKAQATQSRKAFVTTIKLSHSVYYGVYLEYAMGRRFAIIQPTIDVKGHDYVDGLHGILGPVIIK